VTVPRADRFADKDGTIVLSLRISELPRPSLPALAAQSGPGFPSAPPKRPLTVRRPAEHSPVSDAGPIAAQWQFEGIDVSLEGICRDNEQ